MLASESPAIVGAMFEMAEFAYFDSPLPGLFEERSLRTSRASAPSPIAWLGTADFSSVLGHVAGDREIPSVSVVVRLADGWSDRSQTRRTASGSSTPRASDVGAALCVAGTRVLRYEGYVFDAAAVAFFDRAPAQSFLPELQRLLGRISYEYLVFPLTFLSVCFAIFGPPRRISICSSVIRYQFVEECTGCVDEQITTVTDEEMMITCPSFRVGGGMSMWTVRVGGDGLG